MKRHEDDIEPADISALAVAAYSVGFLLCIFVGLWAARIYLLATEVPQ